MTVPRPRRATTTHVDATHAHTRLHDWYERTSSRRRQTHARTHSRRPPPPPLLNNIQRGAWIHHPSKRRHASVVVGFERAHPSVRFGCSFHGACSTKDDEGRRIDPSRSSTNRYRRRNATNVGCVRFHSSNHPGGGWSFVVFPPESVRI